MTDQEIEILEEKDAALDEILLQYQPPRYDPFEVFKPTKTFLKEIIKELKQDAYAKTKIINGLEQKGLGLPVEIAHEQICRRIKQLEYYAKGGTPTKDISESDIARAKEYPISSLYEGKLKRTGSHQVGRCPFHTEKSGSFTIYSNNSYYCFGCGVGGDVLDFIQRRDNLKFIEAVKRLINK